MPGRLTISDAGLTALRGLVLGLTVTLALTACGGGPEAPQVASAATAAGAGAKGSDTRATATPSAGDATDQALRYADCLEEHDVILMQVPDGPPEPDKVKTPIGTVDAAMKACESVRPAEDLPDAPSEDDLQRARDFAACIREHGVPDWPDPDGAVGAGEADPDRDAKLKDDPDMPAALKACERINQVGGGSQGKAGG